MSLQEMWGTTIVFPGQGSADGYEASGGPLGSKMEVQADGSMIEVFTKSFRIQRALVAGLTIVGSQTHVTESGRTFRVESIGDQPGDPCLHLNCRQL